MLAIVLFFVLGLPVIVLIKDSVKKRKRELEKEKSRQKLDSIREKSEKTNITFSEDYFEHYLDNIMRFIQTFYEREPDKWYHFYISQEFRQDNYTDNHYVETGYLKFEISVGIWWDGILRDPEMEDYMKSNFTFDPSERTFTRSIRTGKSTCCVFPHEKVNAMLQQYLDNYESKHPEIHFERFNWGARLSSDD